MHGPEDAGLAEFHRGDVFELREGIDGAWEAGQGRGFEQRLAKLLGYVQALRYGCLLGRRRSGGSSGGRGGSNSIRRNRIENVGVKLGDLAGLIANAEGCRRNEMPGMLEMGEFGQRLDPRGCKNGSRHCCLVFFFFFVFLIVGDESNGKIVEKKKKKVLT